MNSEPKDIKDLLRKLRRQKRFPFPKPRTRLNAPKAQGVYVIYCGDRVMHVGRTLRGKGGIHQRLNNHLHGQSSFTAVKFDRMGWKLRNGYEYQYLEVRNSRKRALLEAYAIGMLCPNHIGLGE